MRVCNGRRQINGSRDQQKEERTWLTLCKRKQRRQQRRFFQEDRKASGGPSAWRIVTNPIASYSATTMTITTTHITYTPWMMYGKRLYTAEPSERHDVSITTDLSQHAHCFRFANRADCKRDQLIDRSPIPIVSSRGEVEGESESAWG